MAKQPQTASIHKIQRPSSFSCNLQSSLSHFVFYPFQYETQHINTIGIEIHIQISSSNDKFIRTWVRSLFPRHLRDSPDIQLRHPFVQSKINPISHHFSSVVSPLTVPTFSLLDSSLSHCLSNPLFLSPFLFVFEHLTPFLSSPQLSQHRLWMALSALSDQIPTSSIIQSIQYHSGFPSSFIDHGGPAILELFGRRPASIHSILALYEINSPSAFYDVSSVPETFSSIPILLLAFNRIKT
jgi:hypothetical protein